MKSLYNYIIYTDSRYDNKKNIDGKELILNSELSERDYKFVNRIGTVKSVWIIIATIECNNILLNASPYGIILL